MYANREDAPHHMAARTALLSLVHGAAPFAIPWPCVSEFLAIATHPRIYLPPSPIDDALAAVDALRALPHARFIGEDDGHVEMLRQITRPGVAGPQLHDARIAAICLTHGVTELWTADRDFSFFPELRTRNPLVQQ